MNQEPNNEFNGHQGNNSFTNNQNGNVNNFNNIPNSNQQSNINMYENQNNQTPNNTININSYQQPVNKKTSTNGNLENNLNNKGISKKGKIMMFIVLISTLIIFFDNFITSMDWFWELQQQATMNQDEQLKLALQTFKDLIVVINWSIVLIITILSIIFLINDQKKQHNVRAYEWYIMAGISHILIGTVGLTPIIYSVSTLVFALKNKKNNIIDNLSIKSDNILIAFSSILIASIIFIFIAMQTNLFDKIENKIEDYQENKEVIIEDKDNSHIATTFDKIIDVWGNNVVENKSYKIKNVKLNNITASLFIDYSFKLENEKPNATLTIKHGDNELYTYTEKENYFNLSYLKLYDNLIIYGTNYCDNVDNGICSKHLTYSQVLAFNKDDFIPLYDRSIISQDSGTILYRDTSVFLEDENIYEDPYNDFRVYDIKINNDNIYFYTVVENYDEVFTKDYNFRNNNCNDPFWKSIDFDMQRTFKTSFTYNESYKSYELDELIKQSSIQYADYCTNKNILDF